MDNLFIGNIVQRTWEETESDGITATGKVNDYILKQDAILYKTKNGGYVNVVDLLKKRDFKSVDKIVLDYGARYNKKGILVMPAASFSQAIEETKNTGRDSTLGVFVNSDTLKPYSVYTDTQDSSQNLSR